MFNIRFVKRDNKNALDEIVAGTEIVPERDHENVHCLKQINSFAHTVIPGIIAAAAIMLGMVMITKWRLAYFEMTGPINKDLVFILEVIIAFSLVFLVLLPIVHEFLHAVAYPRHAQKTIYASSNWVCCTYCEAKMRKGRTILMLLLPLSALCILPFAVLMLLMPVISLRDVVIILMAILYMVFSSLHDLGSALVIAFHVPAKAYVFVKGKYLYWEDQF